ncbi:MAG: hypothetical protein KGZ79_10425 [Dethiobacter sp.]|jgi:hypothetical protein|nr:hypothetical protein [Dethiobacter sp.]
MFYAKKNTRNISADFIVRVSSVQNATWQGKIEHIQSGQAQLFRSFLEMLFLAQEKLDTLGYPQPDTELRSWSNKKYNYLSRGGKTEMANCNEQEVSLPVGGLSFLIRVQFRQNSTWQGTVQWLDKKKTRPFRSLLELVNLVNEAINDNAEVTPEPRMWTEKEFVS